MRQNGEVVRFKLRPSLPAAEQEGRSHCRLCGRAVPRGVDRPFCLEHAPYVRRLLRALAASA